MTTKICKAAMAAMIGAILMTGCGPRGREDDHAAGAAREAPEVEPWSVTAWGEIYELFPETAPLVAGASSPSHTHVTILDGFAPLREGKVEAILRSGSEEHAFAGQFKRDGIFEIALRPPREGEFELSFRITSAAGPEEVRAGKVKVGSAREPGGRGTPPGPPTGTTSDAETGEISFLKEQQWRTEFATAWVREGRVASVVRGTARVRPAAGGEVILTAPVDAVVARSPWPHQGLHVARGAAVFRLQPSGDSSRSLPALSGEAVALGAESAAATARVRRLEELLKAEAVSLAEVERARAVAAGFAARLEAARRDLAAARAARTGGSSGATLPVLAPWSGIVAGVDVTPGQAVTSGTPLGRLVKATPIWLELALRPEDAARLTGRIEGVTVRRASDPQPLTIPAGDVRLVSRAAEIDPRTGTRAVLLEIRQDADTLPIGAVLEAEALLGGGAQGIVIPASALIDDGGTQVVYVQVSGEGFARREVRVTGRAGAEVAVEGLKAGERLVTRGGAAIRRASLLGAGAPEGHVH